MSWVLEDALEFVRKLDPVVRTAGYSVGLAGSVLTKGESPKDLDLLLFPLSTEKVDVEDLVKTLREFGMRLIIDREHVKARWEKLGSEDEKWVEVWRYEGKRVDLFFVK
jgi:hypothetical protein